MFDRLPFIAISLAFALALALVLPSGAVVAAELATDPQLETMVVEGSRLSQGDTEIGSGVSVLTAADIDRLGFDFVLDALAAIPSVTINQNGAFGGQASVRIRGAGSEQTLVLIDGVVANDSSTPGGGFNFARLDTENIERIEVLRGPQSTLWGTDAIGGVVSITTKRPAAGRLSGSVFGEFGSFNSQRGGAAIASSGERGDFRVAVTANESDGISKADAENGNSEEDGFESLTVSAHGGLNLPRDGRLESSVLWTDAESEFDSFSGGAQGSVADGDERSATEELVANLTLTLPAFDGRLQNRMQLGYSEIERQNFTDGAPSFGAEGQRTLLRYQGTFRVNDQQQLAFGAERDDSENGSDDTTIDGIFALYELSPIDALTLSAGLRHDDHERFGGETTARVAAAYNPTPSITLRGSWGQGFKAPSLFQTSFFCCGAVAPNQDLQPETSVGVDAGIDWRSESGSADLSVTIFSQDIENQIDFSFAAGGYENISEVRSRGVEFSGSVRPLDWLSVEANFAFIDAQDGDDNRRARVPARSGDLVLGVNPTDRFSGALLVRYNSREPNTDGTQLAEWTRVDLNAQYQVTEQLQLFARIENLTDENYQQVLGYGTPERSGTFGVRFRY